MKPILLLFIILFISKSISFQDYIYLENENDDNIVNGVIENSSNSNTGSSTGSSGNSGNNGNGSGNSNSDNSDGSSYTESSLDKTLLNVTTVVSFFNGKSPCKNSTSCTDIKYSYATHYACSPIGNDFDDDLDYDYDYDYDDSPNLYTKRQRETVGGDWNKGIKYFDDPIPADIPSSSVENVAFVIMGVVGCTPLSSVTSLTFLIQDYQIGDPITTKRADDCSCGFCVLFYEIPSKAIEMDSYNKSGRNKFQINVQYNTICVTNISIIFYYKPNPPPTTTPIPTGSSSDNGNHDNPSSQQIKKYIIISISVAAAVLLLVGGFIFIRNRLRNRNDGNGNTSGGGGGGSSRNKKGYTLIKDGKDIDIHQIKIGARIGKGNFGEVFLGTWRGSQVAVKKLPAHNINENVLKEFHREINLMKNLRHPNVIQFLGSCSIPPDICICTEFMPRGSLYSILHDSSLKLSWDLVIRMLIDAVKGVIYLHGSNPVILHRDLKSHNLLVDENWKVKVADFGLSTIEQQGATMTACGTPCWTSPEVLRSQRYTEKADVYSFGIILWECATRQDPYYGMPSFQVIFAVGREGLRPPTPTNSPKKYLELLADCLSENPLHRPTMEQCLERLEVIDTYGFDDIIYSTPTISPNTPTTSLNNNNAIN